MPWFIIKNSKIELHLYDSGLLQIPFELCVNRKASNSILLEEIPDYPEEIQLDEMDTIDLNSETKPSLIKNNEISDFTWKTIRNSSVAGNNYLKTSQKTENLQRYCKVTRSASSCGKPGWLFIADSTRIWPFLFCSRIGIYSGRNTTERFQEHLLFNTKYL